MKKILMILGMVSIAAAGAYAQVAGSVGDNYPYRIISKDVQRIQHKPIKHTPARITSGDAAWANSKAVHNVSGKQTPERKREIRMTGTPSWAISKGVGRIQP